MFVNFTKVKFKDVNGIITIFAALIIENDNDSGYPNKRL